MLRFLRPNKPDSMPDEALLAQFRATDRTEFLGTLYDRYLEMVFGVCLKIFRDRGRAEDAVMAIFEELITKVKAHEIGSFRGWLYVLARNHCLMELRKTSSHPVNHLPPEEMSRFDGPENDFDFELPGAKTSLQHCLDTLADGQKDCILGFYFDEKSYQEISLEWGIELGMVRSHIQNGRRNLKICLEKAQTGSIAQ